MSQSHFIELNLVAGIHRIAALRMPRAISHAARLAFLVVFCTALWIASGVEAATAQSISCRSLQAELSALETGRSSAGSPRFRQFDRAVRQQISQIRKTEGAAARSRCDVRRNNVCRRINNSLIQMRDNLAMLERERDRLAPRRNVERQRRQLIRTMQVNGCIDSQRSASVEPEPDRRRTLLEQIFGTKTYTEDSGLTEGAGQSQPKMSIRGGTYRTLCVRTCDGYYFPISFSTTGNRFDADEAQCEAMCPGAQTELFFHPMPQGDAEEAISYRGGKPYAELENAFSYRKQFNRECTCRSAATIAEKGFQTIAGATKLEKEPVSEAPVIGTPVFRVDRDVDMDGLAMANGGLSADDLIALIGERPSQDKTVNRGNIRIVGPEFFPVQ